MLIFYSFAVNCCNWSELKSLPNWQNIEEVNCSDCPNLKSLPNWQNIEDVRCSWCPELEELPNWQNIKTVTHCTADATHGPNRSGDIPHSLASIKKAQNLLGYNGKIKLKEGLERTFEFYNVL